jgi:hypothetical protein
MVESYESLVTEFMSLYNEEKYSQALDLVRHDPFPAYAPTTHCWRIAMLSKTGNNAAALREFESALDKGYFYLEAALRGDPDFAPLRAEPEFDQLVERSNQLRSQALTSTQPKLEVLGDASAPAWRTILALHGNSGNIEGIRAMWQRVADLGWRVALAQSSQLSWVSRQYDWDNSSVAQAEIAQHIHTLGGVDIMAGFSKGGEEAWRAALTHKCSGLIAIDPTLPESNNPFAPDYRGLRAYFNLSQPFVDAVKEFLATATFAHLIEASPAQIHSYPADFAEAMQRALNFITAKP